MGCGCWTKGLKRGRLQGLRCCGELRGSKAGDTRWLEDLQSRVLRERVASAKAQNKGSVAKYMYISISN